MPASLAKKAGLALLALVCLGCLAALAMIAFELTSRATGSPRAGLLAGAAVVALAASATGLLLKKRG